MENRIVALPGIQALQACFTVLVTLALGGCISTAGEGVTGEEPAWHYCKVRFQWPEGEAPDLSFHTLVADQVFRPVLELYGPEIKLWRFHRRAAQDHAGNQLSLIYYSDDTTARDIQNAISSELVLQELVDAQVVETVLFVDGSSRGMGSVSATSDAAWPTEIQKSWPWFAMGVSHSWMELVGEVVAQDPVKDKLNNQQLVDYYRRIDLKISALWRAEGAHAYIHHLNALFGYQPVYLYDSREYRSF